MPSADHRSHKRLNNRAENSHQPTRRKEKCWVKFKSPHGVQKMLALMGRTRNIFLVSVRIPLRKDVVNLTQQEIFGMTQLMRSSAHKI